ncbi:MAG: protein-L-isoaspartate(D-aspartate) O-methyltransferase [bacterium]|nr:protein-L-isoaspartate(D-aspartate) O-methyltransferase [bacterium]
MRGNSDRQAWAREKMVEKDIIPRGIKDEGVLDAMRKVPRHLFVEGHQRMSAYEDHPLPIGEGQTISQPYIVAAMTEALKLSGTETVLEIGTGSGYQTAILAELAAKVYSVERVPSLTGKARKVLDSLGCGNVLVKLSDGTLGWDEYAPYDRILVTAGAPWVPAPLTGQLKPGGILVIPVGSNSLQELTRVTKGEDGTLREERLGSCVFVRLVGKHGWEAGY